MTLETRMRAALIPYAGAMPMERFDAMVAAAVRAAIEERGPEIVRMDAVDAIQRHYEALRDANAEPDALARFSRALQNSIASFPDPTTHSLLAWIT